MPVHNEGLGNITSASQQLEDFLHRPIEHRRREYKYRCAQAVVFGLPVIALQYVGTRLGGLEAERWTALLQAALSAWVTYIAATGMISEGFVVFLSRRHVTLDLLVAAAALAMELISLISVSHLLIDAQIWYRPLMFHVVVTLLAVWSGVQWARSSRRITLLHAASEERPKL